MGRRIDFVKSGLLKGYKFDGCTNAPDLNAADCCAEHDYHYQDLDLTRAQADKKLRKCMQKKGWIILPWIYWGAVRIFGGNHYARKQNESTAKVGTPDEFGKLPPN